MAHAYTPGLKVLHQSKIRKERRLPLKGEVIVKKGLKVSPNDIVATTNLPGNCQFVNVANLLNIDSPDILEVMLKKEGSQVNKGDLLAETKGFFGRFKSSVEAPISGTVESISKATGQVCLREAPIPVEIDAYMHGIVDEVIPGEGVIIVADAVFIQGIFGIGGESRGELRVITETREDEITPEMLTPEMEGEIIVGGSFISLKAYQKALKLKLAGIVVGGFNYYDLEIILGYTLGVAITGHEDLVTSLIITEGYGKIRMGQRSFNLLKQHHGKFASMNGATQIRAGVIRPEIIISLSKADLLGNHQDIHVSKGIEIGSQVRIIRAPNFGRMGLVKSLPAELKKMESETMVRVAEIEINGKIFNVPRSNLELVETE